MCIRDRPCIYEVESGRSIIPSTELFDRQYEVYGPEWNPDSRAVTFEYNPVSYTHLADFAQTRLNRHNFINENTELHKKAVLWTCPP